MKLIKLEFPGGRGAKQKTFCGGGIWIFSGTIHNTFYTMLKVILLFCIARPYYMHNFLCHESSVQK